MPECALNIEHRTSNIEHRTFNIEPPAKLDQLLVECDELIRLFVTSLRTSELLDHARSHNDPIQTSMLNVRCSFRMPGVTAL